MSGGSAAAAAAPSFTVTPNPVVAGNTVTFSGTGCLAIPGDSAGFPKVVVSFVDPSAASMSKAMAAMAASVKPFDDESAVTAIPKADGTWSAPLDVPIGVVGDYPFGATCDHYNSSTTYAPVTLTVTPNPNSPVVIILPDFLGGSGVPALSTGVAYEVIAEGFLPGEKVQVVLHSEPVVLSTFTADEFGLIDGSF